MQTTKSKLQYNELKHSILKELYFNKMQSCNQLSERIHKSIPLVARALNELIEEGKVIDHGYAPSSGGRRPLIYSLPEGKLYIIAVAMDQLATRISMLDLLNNNVAGTEMIELKLEDNDPKALPLLINHIKAFIKKADIEYKDIIGLGIGMPGFVNTTDGINYTYLHCEQGNLLKRLQEQLGLPVYIDNDSSLVALAELKFGMANKHKNVMVVNVGWGIGLGMIVHGELFRGHSGYAGEFSHIPLTENGNLCSCGKRGCLETEASMLLVAEKAVKEIAKGRVSLLKDLIEDHTRLVGDAVMEAALHGDMFAIELLSDMAYKMGKGIAILIHLMNPELIILSGRGAKVGKILMAPIQDALNKNCIPRLAANTELRVSELGYEAELIGAAALVMENFGNKI